MCGCGGIGRRAGFRFQYRKVWKFESSHPYHRFLLQAIVKTIRTGTNRMQVTETLNEGLKRKLSMSIPASDLSARLDKKLIEMKSQSNLKGFRPGKVPMSYLRKTFGRSAMSEILQDAINAGVQETLGTREERAALQPKIDLNEDQEVINKVLEGEADLDFDVSYEILPTVELMDFKKISIEKPIVELDEKLAKSELDRVFRSNREYEDKGDDGVVADGDQIGLNFEGKVDGELFEGGSSDHAHLVIGSGDFIPGFEDKLVGMKKGEKGDVKVTFPKDYNNADLAGKKAVFAVEILHVNEPKAGKLDDEFAKKLGMDDVAALRTAIDEQMNSAHDSMSKQRVKRQILDALDEGHQFDVPEELVTNEFEGIWKRVVHEIEEHGKSFEDEGTTEDKARVQYNKIAERRVRLGLVVAEIGNANKIEITEEEHQQALIAEIRRFPGQEQDVYDYYRKNADALAGLRAPIYENKVVDFVTELAKQTDKKMTRDELAKAIQADEAADDIPEEHNH